MRHDYTLTTVRYSAFLNNKMDLTEVEALHDLIFADTQRQRTQALQHLQVCGIVEGTNPRRKTMMKKIAIALNATQ